MDESAAPSPATEIPPRTGSCLIRGLVIVGIVIVAVLLVVLWYNRPIRPVVLTEPEKVVVEEKLAAMQATAEEAETLPAQDGIATPVEDGNTPPADAEFDLPGKREIAFTDRELNGLLNEHTELGEQISFQFTPGKVLARIAAPLPDDIPVIGGTTMRARASFSVDVSGPSPMLALDDFSVWGVSIPNDWLGGIKNVNLLEEAFGVEEGQGIPGVESLTFEKGRLLIRLKE